MSPRKTRRAAKADGANETLSETMSEKSKESSPLLNQRSMRTRQQLSKTIVQDSESDQTLEMSVSRRKTIQETPLRKSTRSRKRTAVENVTMVDDSPRSPNITTTAKKRTRRAKDKLLAEETILQTDSTTNESLVEKSRVSRARNKTRKEDTKVEEEKPSSRVESVTIDKVMPETEGDQMETSANELPLSKEDTEVQQMSDKTLRLKDSSVATRTSPRTAGKQYRRNVRSRIEDCTPESSPITVNLSPHRSTKTPRKSPMNLGSPKSHADQSHRLSKTPRKLPVVVESPIGSDKSDDSSIYDTPKKSANQSSETKSRHIGSSERKKKRTSKGKSSIKSPGKSPSKCIPVRKFSKSPKIMLRTPKVKTPKSKSPRIVSNKVKVSPLPKRFRESPKKSRQSLSLEESRDETKAESTLSKRKNSRSPKKSATATGDRENRQSSKLDSPNDTSSTSVTNSPPSQMKTIDGMKSPTVVLNKLELVDIIGTSESTRRSSSRRSIPSNEDSPTTTPIVSPSVEKLVSRVVGSPRRSKSAVKKITSVTDLGTPVRTPARLRATAVKRSIGKLGSVTSSKNTPMEGGTPSGKVGDNPPMLSSTPRERIRRSLNLLSDLGATPVIVKSPINEPPVGSSTMITDVRPNRSLIENESNPLISEDDHSTSLNAPSKHDEQSCLDETFEIVKKNALNVEEEEIAEEEEDKPGDSTYELIEPKTPVLRRKATKRSLAEMDSSTEERVAKRSCRVRFASPQTNHDEVKTVLHKTAKARSATPGQTVRNVNVTTGRILNGGQRRSNSAPNVSMSKTPTVSIERNSTSTATSNVFSASKTAQNASVSRLSKPRLVFHQLKKKTEIQTPVAKKAPNFAQIHERKFAKMESLVDAKKRVERRHLAMNSSIPTSLSKVNTAARSKPKVSPKSIAPSVSINGVHNRYGFKLRKNEAMKIVSQKQRPVHTSETKQNENRLLVKGVRTNRRFDLMMKVRNIQQ